MSKCSAGLEITEGRPQGLPLYHPGLADVEKRLMEMAGSLYGLPAELASFIIASGGKRIRPILALHSSDFAECDHELAVDVATSVELVHMASIVHDDVIDQAMSRRGRETINARWGNHLAVLTGDLLLSKALEILSRRRKYGVVRVLANTVANMSQAEMIQASRAFDERMTEAEYTDYVSKKTAYLMAASCYSGAATSRAGRKRMACMWEYGLYLGIAFQIIDDTLDIVGDETMIGKPTGKDLACGVMTLPIIRGLQHPVAGPALREIMRSRRTGAETLSKVHHLLLESGAIAYSYAQARKYVEFAKAKLQSMPDCSARDCLLALAELVITRNA
ncbi:MAG TPA: polyprenyl synthetase family protein [Firmicutes bacterium]|nr:polyprenyl synthetase family protein [Bacillota bacterium]